MKFYAVTNCVINYTTPTVTDTCDAKQKPLNTILSNGEKDIRRIWFDTLEEAQAYCDIFSSVQKDMSISQNE